MNDLISRQAVRLIESDHDAYPQEWNDDYEKGFADCLEKALALPSIDAVPVKHGRWKNISFLTVECSECKTQIHDLEYSNFCPNCGAKMDETVDE